MMSNNAAALRSVFSKNRTEELGYDVWEHFVVPPFYERLDLHEARKPRVIIGGRGCGKTMLLRYLSHQSTFSPKRRSVSPQAIAHIGLYWRVDTQFARVMAGRGLPDDVWLAAFNHLLALVLGIEVLKSLESIESVSLLRADDLSGLRFQGLEPFNPEFDTDLDGLAVVLKRSLKEFEMWVANVRKLQEPIFLPGRHFLLELIGEIRGQLPALKEAVFFAYLDEFENLLSYQQETINTCLKHCEVPLIFHLAMKRHGFVTTKTLGEESVNNIADYRIHDLEQYLLEDDFHLFAAEVLLHNMSLAGLKTLRDIGSTLRDPSLIHCRREQSYRSDVLGQVRSMLPGLTHEELAKQVFSDKSLAGKLRKRIEQALKSRRARLFADSLYDPNLPQATVIVPALLNRSNLKPETVAEELNLLRSGADNKFTGKTDWVHNNFIGALLSLYESHPGACPFYAGFETFCQLARGNMRHFLELCHKSLEQASRYSGDDQTLVVSPERQAHAARQASAEFLGEIRSFGRLGNKLHTFVLSLGSLFALAHSRPSQSEPEQCHFAITRGRSLDQEDSQFLREAVKWSVLFEEEATKVKDDYQPANFEYVLNPIYSPYFHISYRKRRRLEVTGEDLHILISGNYDSVKALLRQYSDRWAVDLPGANQMLFTHLVEDI